MASAACSSSDGPKKDSGVEGDGDSGDGDGDSGDGDGPPRPRVDSGTDGVLGDAIKPCDPFEPDGCAAGQKCDVVLRRSPTAEGFGILTGCVDGVGGRGLGDPCVPWNDFNTPYEAPGLFDEVHVDPCEQGLFCAPDPDIRGLNTCQASCQSGRFQGFPAFGCGGVGQYCQTVDPNNADPFREVCRQSDACDPRDMDSCGGEGRGCYLRTNDTGMGVLSECLSVLEEPVADGEACQFFNDCASGSVCWGPVRVPPSAWSATNVMCRPVCSLDGDDDAGAGGCASDEKCVPFSDSGLDLEGIPFPFGQCE